MTALDEEVMLRSIAEYQKEVGSCSQLLATIREGLESLLAEVECSEAEAGAMGKVMVQKMSAIRAKQTIIPAVAEAFGLTNSALLRRSNEKRIVQPRAIAMLLIRESCEASYPSIALMFGGKHHTTVIHSVEEARKRIQADPVLREVVEGIRTRLAA
jgi:chromosomal replication initiator protein